MKVLLLLFIGTLSSPCLCIGQQKIITSFQTSENSYATLDRAGDLYLVKNSGAIEKYNSEGQLLNSLRVTVLPTLFDTGNGVRLLAYYRKYQTYTIMNPFLTSISSHTLDSS